MFEYNNCLNLNTLNNNLNHMDVLNNLFNDYINHVKNNHWVLNLNGVGYIYKITYVNPASELHLHWYVGSRRCQHNGDIELCLQDVYWGSGSELRKLKREKRKHPERFVKEILYLTYNAYLIEDILLKKLDVVNHPMCLNRTDEIKKSPNSYNPTTHPTFKSKFGVSGLHELIRKAVVAYIVLPNGDAMDVRKFSSVKDACLVASAVVRCLTENSTNTAGVYDLDICDFVKIAKGEKLSSQQFRVRWRYAYEEDKDGNFLIERAKQRGHDINKTAVRGFIFVNNIQIEVARCDSATDAIFLTGSCNINNALRRTSYCGIYDKDGNRFISKIERKHLHIKSNTKLPSVKYPSLHRVAWEYISGDRNGKLEEVRNTTLIKNKTNKANCLIKYGVIGYILLPNGEAKDIGVFENGTAAARRANLSHGMVREVIKGKSSFAGIYDLERNDYHFKSELDISDKPYLIRIQWRKINEEVNFNPIPFRYHSKAKVEKTRKGEIAKVSYSGIPILAVIKISSLEVMQIAKFNSGLEAMRVHNLDSTRIVKCLKSNMSISCGTYDLAKQCFLNGEDLRCLGVNTAMKLPNLIFPNLYRVYWLYENVAIE